jgi:hypothetical protein
MELRKVEVLKTELDSNPKSSWIHFDELSFLNIQLRKKKNITMCVNNNNINQFKRRSTRKSMPNPVLMEQEDHPDVIQTQM